MYAADTRPSRLELAVVPYDAVGPDRFRPRPVCRFSPRVSKTSKALLNGNYSVIKIE